MNELMDLKERMEHERPAQWHELPDIALYMDQIIAYMPRQLIRFDDREALTSAMVNNYIKDGLVPRAAGKRYGPIHLGYLTAVCALKKVLSVRDIGILLRAGEERNKIPGGALSVLLRRAGPGPQRHRRRHRRGGRPGGPGPHGAGPGPAQLRRPAGLRPHSGYSPASGGGACQEDEKRSPEKTGGRCHV